MKMKRELHNTKFVGNGAAVTDITDKMVILLWKTEPYSSTSPLNRSGDHVITSLPSMEEVRRHRNIS
jgi:hypothetical protein